MTCGPLSESPEEMNSGPREDCVLALGSTVFWPQGGLCSDPREDCVLALGRTVFWPQGGLCSDPDVGGNDYVLALGRIVLKGSNPVDSESQCFLPQHEESDQGALHLKKKKPLLPLLPQSLEPLGQMFDALF